MRIRNDGLLRNFGTSDTWIRNGLRCFGALAIALALSPAGAWAATQINELRTDNTGTDSDEYFEIKGTPGTDLTGLTYIVIGDAASTTCGTVECVVSLGSLTPHVIQPDGYFAVCKQGPATTPPATLAGYDVTAVTTINFENTDNVTHMIVSGWTGTLNMDVDTNDDGVIDVTPWTSIVDSIGLVGPNPISCAGGVEYTYGGVNIGPDGANYPSHIYRCNDTNAWTLGQFALPPQGIDSPGAANPGCAAAPPTITREIRDKCAPLVGQTVTVTDSIPGATAAVLHYSVNGGAESTINMTSAPTNKWSATLPSQAVNGTRVSYYVTASNANGSDTGFTWGYFVGTMDVASLRVNDGTGLNLYRFYGVRLHGVVTTDNFSNGNVNTDFYVQDATGGLNVFQTGLHASYPARGSEIITCGVLAQFNGNLEITTSGSVPTGIEIDVQGPGTLPTPILINSCQLNENYEGFLVRLEYPQVDTAGATTLGAWRGNDTSKLWNCGTSVAGTFTPTVRDLFIDDATDIDGTPVVSLQMGVTGIANQSDSATPFDANYRVSPRTLADITYIGSVAAVNEGLAARLLPVSPNPFNAKTTLRYEIQGAGTPGARAAVRLTVFDVQGKVVRKLVDGVQDAGMHEVTLTADELGVRSGVFFYQLEVGGRKIATQKLVLSR